MRPWQQTIGVAGLVSLLGLYSCGQQGGRPRAGETVTPRLEGPVLWTAGDSGELGVRLYAKEASDKAARLLDFRAIPSHLSPVANIAFYRGDEPLNSLQIALSHRC